MAPGILSFAYFNMNLQHFTQETTWIKEDVKILLTVDCYQGLLFSKFSRLPLSNVPYQCELNYFNYSKHYRQTICLYSHLLSLTCTVYVFLPHSTCTTLYRIHGRCNLFMVQCLHTLINWQSRNVVTFYKRHKKYSPVVFLKILFATK